MEEKIKQLCDKITLESHERLKNENLGCDANLKNAIATYRIGKKYIAINKGNCGWYMVEKSTANIYGIKAYGVIHRGHWYGTLDTINDYYWGDYTAYKKEVSNVKI